MLTHESDGIQYQKVVATGDPTLSDGLLNSNSLFTDVYAHIKIFQYIKLLFDAQFKQLGMITKLMQMTPNCVRARIMGR
jgi:hypothetical protein